MSCIKTLITLVIIIITDMTVSLHDALTGASKTPVRSPLLKRPKGRSPRPTQARKRSWIHGTPTSAEQKRAADQPSLTSPPDKENADPQQLDVSWAVTPKFDIQQAPTSSHTSSHTACSNPHPYCRKGKLALRPTSARLTSSSTFGT